MDRIVHVVPATLIAYARELRTLLAEHHLYHGRRQSVTVCGRSVRQEVERLERVRYGTAGALQVPQVRREGLAEGDVLDRLGWRAQGRRELLDHIVVGLPLLQVVVQDRLRRMFVDLGGRLSNGWQRNAVYKVDTRLADQLLDDSHEVFPELAKARNETRHRLQTRVERVLRVIDVSDPVRLRIDGMNYVSKKVVSANEDDGVRRRRMRTRSEVLLEARTDVERLASIHRINFHIRHPDARGKRSNVVATVLPNGVRVPQAQQTRRLNRGSRAAHIALQRSPVRSTDLLRLDEHFCLSIPGPFENKSK